MKYCSHCGNAMMDQDDRCRKCGKQVPLAPDDDNNIMASVAVAAITDSAALGYLAGGNLLGAVAGDALFDGSLDIF